MRQTRYPEIIVGTGGADLDTLAATAGNAYSNPNVVTGQDKAFGVLNLTLGSHGYSNYKPVLAGPASTAQRWTYSDSGRHLPLTQTTVDTPRHTRACETTQGLGRQDRRDRMHFGNAAAHAQRLQE